jgi:hypothetical protein
MSATTITVNKPTGTVVIQGSGPTQTVNLTTGKTQVVQLGSLSAAVNQQITQAVASATASAETATAAASTATNDAGVATEAAGTATAQATIATEEAGAAAASAIASANAYGAIANGAATDAGALTGAEIVPLSRTAGLLQTTLAKAAAWTIQTAATFSPSLAGIIARTVQSVLADTYNVKNWGAVGNYVTNDTAAIAAAVRTLVTIGKPFALFFPSGYYIVNATTLFNQTLDCNQLVSGITLYGPPTHTTFNSGGDGPAVIAVPNGTTLTSVFDLRACNHINISNLSFTGPSTVTQFINLGAQGCANSETIGETGNIENCKMYGAQYGVNAYDNSGIKIINCNISQAQTNAVLFNACGDFNLVNNLFNNTGPLIYNRGTPSTQISTNYYQGAAVLIYGGGGDGNITGGKIEVNNKGVVLDSVQGVNISGIVFDKNAEFAVGIGGNQTISGQTGLGYQPRSISVTGCHFSSSGMIGTYGCHIYVNNFGVNLQTIATITGNTFGYGGTKGIDYDTTVDTLITAVGPAAVINAVNNGTSGSFITVNSTGNQYYGGAQTYTFQSFTASTTFRSQGDYVDNVNMPNNLSGGANVLSTSVVLTASFTFFGGTLPAFGTAGYYVNLPFTSMPGVKYGDFIQIAAPVSHAGISIEAWVSSTGTVTGHMVNLAATSSASPQGTFTLRCIK